MKNLILNYLIFLYTNHNIHILIQNQFQTNHLLNTCKENHGKLFLKMCFANKSELLLNKNIPINDEYQIPDLEEQYKICENYTFRKICIFLNEPFLTRNVSLPKNTLGSKCVRKFHILQLQTLHKRPKCATQTMLAVNC